MNVFNIALLSAAIAGILGVIAYEIWYRKTHRPTSWVHKGMAPPAGTAEALEVIRGLLPVAPGRWGGWVDWVSSAIPFKNTDGTQHEAGGIVVNDTTPEVRVQWFKNVWETALAHELIHVFAGWADGDARLDPLVQKMNDEIKKKLAAVG